MNALGEPNRRNRILRKSVALSPTICRCMSWIIDHSSSLVNTLLNPITCAWPSYSVDSSASVREMSPSSPRLVRSVAWQDSPLATLLSVRLRSASSPQLPRGC